MLTALPHQKKKKKKALPPAENPRREIESGHGPDLARPYCASSENEKAASIFALMKLVTLWKVTHLPPRGFIHSCSKAPVQYGEDRFDSTWALQIYPHNLYQGDSFSDTALIIKVDAVLFNLLWYRNAGGKKKKKKKKRRSECIEPLYDSIRPDLYRKTEANQNIHFHFVECRKTIYEVAGRSADVCSTEPRGACRSCVHGGNSRPCVVGSETA